MPIYEYRCDNGHVFDVIQRMADDPLTECQECGAPAVRVLHPVAIHFKGSGFHNTDYKTKKPAAASSDGAKESTGSDSGSSSGSDSGSSADSGSSGGEAKPKAASASAD